MRLSSCRLFKAHHSPAIRRAFAHTPSHARIRCARPSTGSTLRPQDAASSIDAEQIKEKVTEAVEGRLAEVATSTVEYLIDGLEDVPSEDSSYEASETLSIPATDVSLEEENPYTSQDALSLPPPTGGSPELEAVLEAAEQQPHPLTLDQLLSIFPFTLDGFQQKAVQHFLQGSSVVVCAPTGAGKTAIAEAAATAALARGQRVIYTTPLKALSNQKMYEKRLRFGAARVGLQTGDTSLNTDADIVIMTTEILRNIMYRTAETLAGGSGTTRDERLGDVGLIVLDEVHYLGDPWRGSVWEEVIINCPKHIQMLAMSATVKNPDALGGWIEEVHGPCMTVKTRFRPVPLRWLYCYRDPAPDKPVLSDLFDSSGRKLNDRLRSEKWLQAEQRYVLRQQSRRESTPEEARAFQDKFQRMLRSGALLSKAKTKRIPSAAQVLTALDEEQMLPAIWFIMNRKDCDGAAVTTNTILTSGSEQEQIREEVIQLSQEQPDVIRPEFVEPLLRGVAAHHAGLLPAWKTLVEKLFQRGLVKLVYATGTLAAGINMPARTTIISSLARRTDEGIKLLPHNEMLQMAGRAGRRGYDTQGNCVVLQTRYEGAEEAVEIIRAGPEPLVSQFSTSYGLVLNLLSVKSLEQAKTFLSQSFGTYQSGAGSLVRRQQIAELEAKAAQCLAEFEQAASPAVQQAQALFKMRRKELQAAKLALLDQRVRHVQQHIEAGLAQQQLPVPVLLDLSKQVSAAEPAPLSKMVFAVALAVAPGPPRPEPVGSLSANRQYPWLYCLAGDNRWMCVSGMHVAACVSAKHQAAVVEQLQQASNWSSITQQVMQTALSAKGWSDRIAKQHSCQVTVGSSSSAQALSGLNIELHHFLVWSGPRATMSALQQLRAACKAAGEQLSAAQASMDGSCNSSSSSNGSNSSSSGETGKNTGTTAPAAAEAAPAAEPAAVAAGSNGRNKGARGHPTRRRDLVAKAKTYLQQAQALQEELDMQQENNWQSFLNVLQVLMDMEAMDSSHSLLPLGMVARSINGTNELWLALALSLPGLDELSPPQFASYLGAIISNEMVKKNIMVWAPYQVSDEVLDLIDSLEGPREALLTAQTAAGCERWNDALLLDLRLAGLVEAWAAGASWQEVVGDTNLDDGDMARLLARTMDLLKQIKVNSHLLPHLEELAKRALAGMYRPPVADLVL